MADAFNWLVGTGLLGLVFTLAYREWEAWRERRRELKGLLFTLYLEIDYNRRSLAGFENSPNTIHLSVGSAIQTKVWDKSMTRVAQLLNSKDDFQSLAAFYSNLENVVMPVLNLSTIAERADKAFITEDTKKEFVLSVAPDMQEQASETMKMICKYIPKPIEQEFGLPFASEDSSTRSTSFSP